MLELTMISEKPFTKMFRSTARNKINFDFLEDLSFDY